ncbi:MAG: cupin domain-containing protein [Actinophytocola sp.]|nr:cupin domain-containing protein [Actinophytocola sp.]
MSGINISEKLAQFSEHWSPKTIATINDYDVRLVKVQGEFVRHNHADTDELFLVIDGQLTIRFGDSEVTLGPGELHVVPRGVYHQPVAEGETSILLFEPSETVNTGDAGGELTAERTRL